MNPPPTPPAEPSRRPPSASSRRLPLAATLPMAGTWWGRFDAVVARALLWRLVVVVAAILAIAVALDLVINIGTFSKGAARPDRWKLMFELYMYRLPVLANIALPVGMLVSALLVGWPMLKNSELVGLSASGISPGRACRGLLLVALGIGAVDTVMADMISPHALAHATLIQDQLRNQRFVGRVWQVPHSNASWFAVAAIDLPSGPHPALLQVVVASPAGLVVADRLEWNDDHWDLAGRILRFGIGPDKAYFLDRLDHLPLSGDLQMTWKPGVLYRHLLPAYTLTGPELLAAGDPVDVALAWSRWSRVFIPFLMVMMALPVFLRWDNQKAAITGALKALAAAAVPVGIISAGGMVADTLGPHPALVMAGTVILAAVPGFYLWIGWRL